MGEERERERERMSGRRARRAADCRQGVWGKSSKIDQHGNMATWRQGKDWQSRSKGPVGGGPEGKRLLMNLLVGSRDFVGR